MASPHPRSQGLFPTPPPKRPWERGWASPKEDLGSWNGNRSLRVFVCLLERMFHYSLLTCWQFAVNQEWQVFSTRQIIPWIKRFPWDNPVYWSWPVWFWTAALVWNFESWPMPATVPRISGTGNIKVIHEKGYGNIAIMKRNFRNDHPEVTAFLPMFQILK